MLISGLISSVLCGLYCAAYGIKMFGQQNKKAGLLCLAIAAYIAVAGIQLVIV